MVRSFSTRKIKQLVSQLELDLTGKTVITEAATGYYAITAAAAAYAGADTYVFAKSTKYGSDEDAYSEVKYLSSQLNCADRIFKLSDFPSDAKADVITNSGHLRPLEKNILEKLSPSGCIPLMFEEWELRKSDFDWDYLCSNQIPLIATNERHPSIDVFGFLGDMALKLALDAGKPLYRSSSLILANNAFAYHIYKTIKPICSRVHVVSSAKDAALFGPDYLADFDTFEPQKFQNNIDIIFYTAAPFQEEFISKKGAILPETLVAAFGEPVLLRFCGDINEKDCQEAGLQYYPNSVPSGHMGIIPSEIGSEPVLRLQIGSLKAASAYLAGDLLWNGAHLGEKIDLNER